jgi:adenylate kinase family enzyme
MNNNKYEKAKVYKIWSTQGDKIYVGSTCKEYLSQRMTSHREAYRQWKRTSQKFVTSYSIFDEYGLDNCFIELLEAKLCTSKDELNQLEGKYIRSLECVNKVIPDRLRSEYRNDTKETAKEYNKQYHDLHKDKINQRKNEKNDCECGGKYIRAAKSQHFKTLRHCQFIESQIIKPEDDEV